MSPLRVLSMKPAVLVAAACLLGLVATGCDEYVKVTRDPDIRIQKGATWAWRPDTPPAAGPARDRTNGRPVVSRDVNPRREVAPDPQGSNQIVQDRVRNTIQQNLTAKGLKQVSDPAAADFLIDYHYAMQRRNETVQTVYPGGAYPGLVCGPYRCWEGWGYGPPEIGYEHIRFRAGTIVFDMLQQSTKHLVYRAVGEKRVQHDTFSLTQVEIDGLVGHLLKDLKLKK
jgi:Domain of unknown function (DUF4136)